MSPKHIAALALLSVCYGEVLAADNTADEQVMVCKDPNGKVSYHAATEARGKTNCEKLTNSGGSFNQVKDFDGFRASLEAKSAEAKDDKPKGRRSKLDSSHESSNNTGDDQRGTTALTSFDFDELQSKRDPKRTQCHVNGETKVNKGCRVEIELIRGALTTVSFSRIGRSNSNAVKWKRVLEGECRDLTVRAVVSECE